MTATDAYNEITVVWDGALESEVMAVLNADGDLVIDETGESVTEWLASIETEANAQGATVEVYELPHGHSPDVEDCACAQYVTDGHPSYTFGPDTDD